MPDRGICFSQSQRMGEGVAAAKLVWSGLMGLAGSLVGVGLFMGSSGRRHQVGCYGKALR